MLGSFGTLNWSIFFTKFDVTKLQFCSPYIPILNVEIWNMEMNSNKHTSESTVVRIVVFSTFAPVIHKFNDFLCELVRLFMTETQIELKLFCLPFETDTIRTYSSECDASNAQNNKIPRFFTQHFFIHFAHGASCTMRLCHYFRLIIYIVLHEMDSDQFSRLLCKLSTAIANNFEIYTLRTK